MAGVWLSFCVLKSGLKSQSKGFLCKFQQSGLKDHRGSRLFLVCLCKQTGKLKTELKIVPLMTMKVILGRKIVVQGKPQ